MWAMIWPVLVVVASNVIYNITTKSTPGNLNPLASLTATYAVAAVVAFVLFLITNGSKNLFAELSKANWTTYLLGVAVVGLEFGYLYIYRAGWKVSTASIVANISLACILLVVGILLYKETVSLKQIIGMCICGIGLVLITK